MVSISFNSLLIVAGIAVLVPVVLGLLPRLPVPIMPYRTGSFAAFAFWMKGAAVTAVTAPAALIRSRRVKSFSCAMRGTPLAIVSPWCSRRGLVAVAVGEGGPVTLRYGAGDTPNFGSRAVRGRVYEEALASIRLEASSNGRANFGW